MHKVSEKIYRCIIVFILVIAILAIYLLYMTTRPYNYTELKEYYTNLGYTVIEPEVTEQIGNVEQGFTVHLTDDTRLEYFVFANRVEVLGFYITLIDGILEMYPNANVDIEGNKIGIVYNELYMYIILNEDNIFCVYTKEGDVEMVNDLILTIPLKNISNTETYINEIGS